MGTVINLLANAIKYSPDAKEVIVYTEKCNSKLLITVEDFGVGIAKEEQGKIFDRFYRTKGMSVLITGFGLGLYICKDIITRHNGEIWVTSDNNGSAFYFSLPLNSIGHPSPTGVTASACSLLSFPAFLKIRVIEETARCKFISNNGSFGQISKYKRAP